jgi:hypothetical protein
MWTFLKAIILKWLLRRSFGWVLALLLAILVPIAGMLKVIGLPILLVLVALGVPVFLVLAAIGLPVLLVVGAGGVLMAIVFGVVMLGLLFLKIVVPIILLVWLLRWLFGTRPDASGESAA